MLISEAQIEEIRARTDIVDLFASYGNEMKHQSGKEWCRCPFHMEKTPSCQVDAAMGRYHCFGCGKSGDVFSFIMDTEGLSFGEAARKLASRLGMELKSEIDVRSTRRSRLMALMAQLSVDFGKMLKAPSYKEAEVAREYLHKRDLEGNVLDNFAIGYVPKDVSKLLAWAQKHGYTEDELAEVGVIKPRRTPQDAPFSYFGGRLVFSVCDKYGRVVAFSGRLLEEGRKGVGKYVNSPETLLFKKSHVIFGFDKARTAIVKAPNREVIVCEGQIDCIRLHMNRICNAVAPLGTAFTSDHASMLHRVADCAFLVFDDDAAGHNATVKAARLLLAEGMPVRVAALPEGHDPDSFIREKGKDAFLALLAEKAQSIVQFQIDIERAKEEEPNSSEAVLHIAKAVLETISKCATPIMREVLVKEAAKILDIDSATLMTDMGKLITAKKADLAAQEASQFADGEEAVETDNSPFPENSTADTIDLLTEDAFIGLLIALENSRFRPKVTAALNTYLPLEILKTPLALSFVNAYLAPAAAGEDPIRDLVENLPPEDYRHFLSLSVRYDPMEEFTISETAKFLYIARQLWQNHLRRALTLNRNDAEKVAKIAQMASELQEASPKAFANLVKNFPHGDFLPQSHLPHGQDEGF